VPPGDMVRQLLIGRRQEGVSRPSHGPLIDRVARAREDEARGAERIREEGHCVLGDLDAVQARCNDHPNVRDVPCVLPIPVLTSVARRCRSQRRRFTQQVSMC